MSTTSNNPKPLLRAQHLYKTYRLGRVDVPVLHGVSIDVAPGEWVAILGASGSGKSTLMHLLGGLDRADTPARAGRVCRRCGATRKTASDTKPCESCHTPAARPAAPIIEFEGRALSSMSTRELDRFRCHEVGFVFQFYHLLPELNVLENVCLGAMIRHGRLGYMKVRGEVRSRAAGLLEEFGLEHRLSHRSSQLSGGERQRVAIARALINEPKVLLADEPTGNLDRETGGALLNSLERLRDRLGLAMVMVTHDDAIADRAGRVVRLVDGVIQG